MADCQTPNPLQALEFQFNGTPSTLHSLMAKDPKRCFTPTASDTCSPGLSPIYSTEDKSPVPATEVDDKQGGEFKKPILIPTANELKPSPAQQKYLLSSPVESSFLDADNSPNSQSQNGGGEGAMATNGGSGSQNSSSCSLLEHNLDVSLLLKNVGLSQYTEAFEKEGINTFAKILNITGSDLTRVGVKSAEQRKVLIDLLKELNTT